VSENAAEASPELIERVRGGDPAARDALFALCYPDLKRLAHQRLLDANRGPSLDTTSLVHDVYLKIANMGGIPVATRAHFMAYAAHAMRSVVIDIVRSRAAEVHGGGATHLVLDTDLGERLAGEEADVLHVHEALEQLAQVDERLVKVVEMRYFAGFSEQEVAATLGVTERTVRRDWQRARALLAAALGR
jgi:RNA polymerase sigma factor (TIGR02999 family)